jgi:hypothetical protein
MIAEEPQPPGGSSLIGPLRRGPNGEIEIVTPSKAARNQTCPSGKDAKSGTTSGPLDSLAPGHWLEVGNSKLAGVLYKGPLADELRGNTGPAGIMSAWGGATFDTNSEALLVWGGGHQDYYGNEVYSFSLKTLQWRRLNEPSSIAGWSRHTGILPDGAPSARHTYGALTFLPRTNQMFSTASSGSMPDGGSTPESWLFNLSANRWTRAADSPYASIDSIAAYDPTDQMVYQINNHWGLSQYNPKANAWSLTGRQALADYRMMGALDPKDRLLVAAGNGYLQSVNLAIGILTNVSSSGDQTIEKANAPGFAWDEAANLFVGWNGGSTVYTLDPHSWAWTAYAAAPDNSVTPTPPASFGTFGRFQYAPTANAFVLVNDINQNVFLYKPCF